MCYPHKKIRNSYHLKEIVLIDCMHSRMKKWLDRKEIKPNLADAGLYVENCMSSI